MITKLRQRAIDSENKIRELIRSNTYQTNTMTTERLTDPLTQDLELAAIYSDFETGKPLKGLLERLEAKQIRGAFDTMEDNAWKNGFTGFDYVNQVWIQF